MAIKSIKHKGLKRLYEAGSTKGLDAQLADKLTDMLAIIDSAETIDEIESFPGWRLHALKGDLAGSWSLTVTGNLRLIFTFDDGEADDLDLTDYH